MLHAHRSHKRLQEARQPRAHPATPRRVPRERAPLPREQARAPRRLPALEPALAARGRPESRVEARQWPLQAHAKRRGNIVGRMFPTLVEGRPTAALARGRGGDTNRPGQRLGALPQRTWVKHLPRGGGEGLVTWWRQVDAQRPAPRRRGPWTWGAAARVCQPSGPPWGRVGPGSRGQAHRGRLGRAGLVRLVVGGAGTRRLPGDGSGRRPDPGGPGRPCRAKLTGGQVLWERTDTAWPRRGLARPAPRVVADRWWGDAPWRPHVASHRRGTRVVEGQRPAVVPRPEGRRVTGPGATVSRGRGGGRRG